MSRDRRARVAILVVVLAPCGSLPGQTLAERNQRLLDEIQRVHGLSDDSMRRMRDVFGRSAEMGQGNPAVSSHSATPEDCAAKRLESGVSHRDPVHERLCGARYMAPLYDPSKEKPQDARVCIDQFEFPDIPCAYPVVWVRAREAALLCEAIGKRLCDAHEWEGACAGGLEPPDYRFDLASGRDPAVAVEAMRQAHNNARAPAKSWSYGREYRTGVCGTSSAKSPGCPGGGWGACGSNTFPAGFFPECHSTLGVYDLNGNAAEHMNLPLDESQMASRGSREYGYTEMKGSWFVFDRHRAHEDWCRWRAPFWHGSRVMDARSHENYHLGFRCCKTIVPGRPGAR